MMLGCGDAIIGVIISALKVHEKAAYHFVLSGGCEYLASFVGLS